MFNVVRGQHPPSSGHLVAFEKGQDGGPVNRVLAGQGECRRSRQVGGYELPNLFGWKTMLDMSRTAGWNATCPGICAVSERTKDIVVELTNGGSDPRIDQIRPFDTPLIRYYPW